MKPYTFPIKDHVNGKSRRYIKCPKCNSHQTLVFRVGAVDHQGVKGFGRERECKDCGFTFKTLEISPEHVSALVRLISAKEQLEKADAQFVSPTTDA